MRVRPLRTLWSVALVLGLFASHGASQLTLSRGPSFHAEPPSLVQFSNSTGATVYCSANGYPVPATSWIDSKGSPVYTVESLRTVGNGSVIFYPFASPDFRPDVHASSLQCEASNLFGRILSRPVKINTVIDQEYAVQIDSQRSYRGNNVILRCAVLPTLAQFVYVTSWLVDGTINVYPAPDFDGKYVMVPSGELVISDISLRDGKSEFQCRTLNKLSGKTQLSSSRGKIIIVESRAISPPRIVRQMAAIKVKVGEPLVLYCSAAGNPLPIISWMVEESAGNWVPFQPSAYEGARVVGPLLSFWTAYAFLPSKFACGANNTAGSDWAEFHVSLSSALSVTASPLHQNADQGSTVEINCTVLSNKKRLSSVQWYRNGMALKQSKRVNIQQTAELLNVVVSEFEPSDKGMYQCFVSTDDETVQASAAVSLGGTLPKLVGTFSGQTVHPGTPISLRCRAQGNPLPVITWMLDDQPLPLSERIFFGHYIEESELISFVNVSAISVEDGGIYKCRAENRVGSDIHISVVNVYGLPYIRPMPRQIAVAGKTFTMRCPASGYPISKFSWLKGGQQLPFNRHHTVFPNGTLTIKELQAASDGGTYTCIAYGPGGESASRTVDLDILVAPKIVPFPSLDAVAVGSRATIVCSISEGETPLTIDWFKNSQPLLTGSGVSVHVFGEFNSFLTIETAQATHTGIYTCKAANTAGVAERSAYLIVDVPPRILPFLFRKDVLENVRIQVSCAADMGDLPMEFFWYKDGRALDGVDIRQIDEYSSMIVIEKASSGDSGNYSCEVVNRADKDVYSALLSISVPPSWKVEPQDVRLLEGETGRIPCAANGSPGPIVSWKRMSERSKDFEDVQSGADALGLSVNANGTLVFSPSRRRHAGSYLCEASNKLGPGLNKIVKVEVNVPARAIVSSEVVLVPLGASATLSCSATGDPPLELIWKTDRMMIQYSGHRISSKTRSRQDGSVISELNINLAVKGDTKAYTCVATNVFGRDEKNIQLLVQEPPQSPRHLQVEEVTSRSVNLVWTPAEDGNSPVRQYKLQYRGVSVPWSSQPHQVLLTDSEVSSWVLDLQPGTSYSFRLIASNALGDSVPSEELEVATLTEPPSKAPVDASLVPLSSSALKVRWDAPPRDTWYSESIQFRLIMREAGSANETVVLFEPPYSSSGTSETTLAGLSAYTKYYVIVQAGNEAGFGPNSTLVSSRTLEDVPSVAPSDLNCVSQSPNTLKLSWSTLPSTKLRGQLTGYSVLLELAEPVLTESKPEERPFNSNSATLAGLLSYTAYSVQVAAATQIGRGPYSESVTCKTLEDIPEPVAGLKVLASSSSSLIASWLPPLKPNGNLIGYAIYLRAVEPTSWNFKAVEPQGELTSDREVLRWRLSAESYHITIGGLISGGKYQAWLAPQTRAGEGPAVRTVTTSLSPPSIPKIVTLGRDILTYFRKLIVLDCVGIGRSDLSRSWEKNGEAISESERFSIKPNGSLVVSHVQRQDRGNYTCHVKSKGLEDMITHVVNILVPPSRPFLSVSSIRSTSLSFSFRLDETGGAVPIGFLVNFRQEGGDWKETKVSRRARTVTFDGLRCGTRYHVRVAAVNVAGVGASNEVLRTSTSGGVPVSPSQESFLQPNFTGVLLRMEEWKDGDCALSDIDVAYKKEDEDIWIAGALISVTAKEKYIGGLEPGTKYSLRVIARNDAGSTERIFTLQTLTPTEDRYGVEDSQTTVYSPGRTYGLSDIRIILSLVISCVAVISVIIGASLLCVKRRQEAERQHRRTSFHSCMPSEMSGQMSDRDKFYSTLRKQSEQIELQGNQPKVDDCEDAYSDISPYATFQLRDSPGNVASLYGNQQLSNYQKKPVIRDTMLPAYSTNPPPMLPERQASLYKETYYSPRPKSQDLYNMSTYPARPAKILEEDDYGSKTPEKRDRKKRRRYARSDDVSRLETIENIRPPSRFLDDSELLDRRCVRDERFVVAV